MSNLCLVTALTLYHLTVSQASHDNIIRHNAKQHGKKNIQNDELLMRNCLTRKYINLCYAEHCSRAPASQYMYL